MSSTSDKHKKAGVDAEVALREAQQRSGGATTTSTTGGGPPQYRLSSLRYWDVRISHTKKYMVAGHFVPSVRGTALSFMSKKRRLTIELYKPTPVAVAATDNNNHEQQTKRLFGQLLKGISSSSLMPIPAMGDDDLVALRILKPKQERRRRGNTNNTNEEDDDGDWDAQSIGSMSLSTLGLAKSPEEDLDFEGPDLRWKERFRCRLDTVQVSDKTTKSCDLTLGEEGSAILKTVHFESKTDFATFLQVMEQMNQLRAERARRLARSYREARSTATSPTSPKHQSLLPSFLGGSPNQNKNTSPSEKQSLLYSDVITIGDSQDETTIEAGGGEGGDAIVGRQIDFSGNVARHNNTNEEHHFDPEDPPASDRVQILVEIVAAYNLPIADILASDPYVKVFDGSHEIHRTQVIPKTLNPVWTVGTKSLFLIDQTIEDYFGGGSNFISFKIKDYDAIKKNNTLGTVEVSKDDLSQGTGERLAFDVLIPGKTSLRRKDLDHPATLALRFRSATPKDVLFMEALAENQKRNKDAVYSIDTFVPPRDHKVSMMKKTNRKGHKQFKEYRVKPFPDPDRKIETTWLTEKEIDMEATEPSHNWIESGTGALGKLFVEVLSCDNLPNLDVSLTGRDKTDAFVCMVFEDCIVHTDVINDSLSPRWMPWSQRAFILNINHPSSQLMVGVFDHDSGLTEAGHDFVGRAVVNLSNLRTKTLYTKTYALHETPTARKEPRGTITLRLRLDIPDYRKALIAGAIPLLNHDVSVAEREYFPVAHQTITHGEQSSVLSLASISNYVQELQSYLEVLFYLQPALATVLLWRGHYPIHIRVPCPKRQPESTGCWDKWSRVIVIKLPLHSVTMFLWGISLARNFDLFPAFLVFAMGWFLLATLEMARNRPSTLYQPRSYLELLSMLVLNHGSGPMTIQSNEDLEEIKAYMKKKEQMKLAREEIVKTIQMEQKKYEAYIQEETSKLEEEVDITTKARGGLSSLTLAPFRGILLPLQQILHAVCIALRVSHSVVIWRDSFVAFWLATICFVATIILIWIPWGFIISWTFKIVVWVFLGPWMKLVDICYVKRKLSKEEAERKKEDLAQKFHARYDMLIGESLARKLRKESALKMKDMKKYMYGKFLMRVPVYKEERLFDDPKPESFAEPFDGSKFGEIHVVARKYGQMLKGDMIPERQMPEQEYSPGLGVISMPTLSAAKGEAQPLLPRLDEEYGTTDSPAVAKPRRRLFGRRR